MTFSASVKRPVIHIPHVQVGLSLAVVLSCLHCVRLDGLHIYGVPLKFSGAVVEGVEVP